VYAGQREHAGQMFEGNWPPIVDVATHLAARRILEDPARKTTITRPGRVKYLLSHIATCGVCGERLTAAPRGGKATYYCPRYCVSMHAEPMDDLVRDEVFKVLSRPELRLRERLNETDDQKVLDARERAATLRARLDEWRDSAARGETTPATLAHIEASLSADIADAERQSHARKGSLAVVALAMADDAEQHWATMTLAGQREAVSMLLRVSLARASAPGRNAAHDYARVRITAGSVRPRGRTQAARVGGPQ
jgi:hypothetical protein